MCREIDAIPLLRSLFPTRLYKTVFPTGLDHYSTPATTPAISRNASNPNLAVPVQRSSFFGRWTRPSGSMLSVPSSPSATGASLPLDGPVEELIVSGTAFGWLITSPSMRVLNVHKGYGLFNLVFSLLPKKVQCVYSMLLRRMDLLTIIKGVSLGSLASNTIES